MIPAPHKWWQLIRAAVDNFHLSSEVKMTF